jgi:hypothetical protein
LITSAADTPAHIAFYPAVLQPALMQREVFNNGQAFGMSRVGYGELVLANSDGELDSLLNMALDGRMLTLRAGQPGTLYPNAWVTVLTARMDAPAVEWDKVSIRLRDRLLDFKNQIQETLYAGDNVLPDGLEGTEDNSKGRPKPLVFGQVFNVTMPCVNTSRLIYQAHDGALSAVDKVYDRGVELTAESAYASQADMETNAPSAGAYRAWLAGGYLRLGSSPAGTLTADLTQGANSLERTAAQVLKAIALRIGVEAADIVAADVTALDQANNATVGLWISDEQSALEAMDAIANSVGAWWGFDPWGRLRMAQMQLPTGAPIFILEQEAILNLQLQATATGDSNIPPRSVEIRYARNYTPQKDLAGSVSDERKAWAAENWRTVTADAASETDHPLADPLVMDTYLITESAATAEATRRATLFGGRRDRLMVTVRLDFTRLTSLDLGAVIQVKIPRFGYNAGKLFRVIGIQVDLRINRANLTLWG